MRRDEWHSQNTSRRVVFARPSVTKEHAALTERVSRALTLVTTRLAHSNAPRSLVQGAAIAADAEREAVDWAGVPALRPTDRARTVWFFLFFLPEMYV